MKSIKYILFFLIMSLFFSCSPFNHKDVNEYDIRANQVSATYIKTNFTSAKVGNQSGTFKKFNNFEYQVKVVLELNRSIYLWDKPIGIVCTPMDGNQQSFILNIDRRELFLDNKHEFIFVLISERKGGVILELGLVDESNGEVIVNNNKFLGKNFYLE